MALRDHALHKTLPGFTGSPSPVRALDGKDIAKQQQIPD
jgi:hypothetical protein